MKTRKKVRVMESPTVDNSPSIEPSVDFETETNVSRSSESHDSVDDHTGLYMLADLCGSCV